ncbi:bifunctional transcriptional activator/DNA repair enzyme AdaA [Halobacillus sp. A5]|uniref:bifunctional transcriptional activator/DNA repair enzyme AdaA n=1 Tax=Halobacillus sp. A5 TaxID=2880263 RepID=UPI0020A66A7F|nr:Ada metal-binding domain-containing protein [Halobacillus sp. A5]MCP3027077.1 helix-turn-helix domain-containing protein [Halobacillus sp. A5]
MDAAVKWEAVTACNKEYDGLFFYAVKTTGIFCRPSCPSKPPKRSNVLFFTNPVDAEADGFRPCKRCRPDQQEDYQLSAGLVEETKQFLQENYHKQLSIHEIASHVSVSPFHFGRVFKAHTSETPHAFVERLRIEQAIHLIRHTDLTNTEICYEAGFQNPASFYKAFKRHTSQTPKQFRKEHADVLR